MNLMHFFIDILFPYARTMNVKNLSFEKNGDK